MAREVVSAKLDVIFKKFFSENLDLLKDFLSEILEIPIDRINSVVPTNPELTPEDIDGKFSRLDLNLIVDDKLVNVEIQVNNDPNYRDRAMFYWSKLFSSELEKGENYSELKQTITINILDFILFPDRTDYHAEAVTVFKDTNELFYDKFHIHFFELRKLGKKFNSNNRREMWLQFIRADSKEEFDMIAGTGDPAMKKAVNIIYDMSDNAKLREIARIREKALHDEASQMKAARDEGISIGIAQGIEQGISQGMEKGRIERETEIISKLRAKGMSESEIKALLS
ncbi:MAG: Rpn family recombination-promoting nuclease/putative transposase [Oscillospiraceae bacterium]|nr:Rpn family recombination-promoting nuclease/putative transposase [Oscillospiraceae bacterium]